ncbi:dihydrolipoamide acetyltransferase family protein [Dictyobacter kobayashii]|uniref:Dihydrolipoamide acetyltransferase component of pyruvate dehydrogenase complex n=1 Tax=Dictyobacter kobayashii TaxID=2014872 RepID=A0A402AMR1_9CHLR|nr:dihydrolipoamide acetyltransferase family protein [Dictyobacter kobayashii]GCE20324.1 lipoamide acyltransferase component of branched-chain alpha-keto acid dehydrogenase complex [Dictyobacter kobayashii]
MPTPVTMPRLGESVAEGTIGAWLKQEGDLIERDESIAEVITDKINAELPSPVAGRLVKILVKVDETVPVGAEIAIIEESADVAAATTSSTPGPDAAPVKSVSEAATPLPDSQPTATTQVARSNGINERVQGEDEERQRISPLARRLAREHGIDLNDIAGTGSGGRVRKEDILAYVAQQQNVATPAATYTPAATAPAPVAQQAAPARQEMPTTTAAELTEAGDEVVVPSRMRLAIAEHMVRSKRTSPHATTVVEIDMTNIAKWLAKNKEEFKRREGYGISFVPFVMKAVCEGIRKFPIINSTWTPDNKIIIKRHINLGMAVSTDTGLVVPTIYDADQYTLAALAKQVNSLAQRARTNKLTIQDMQNSTFVVNNPGVFGTIISMPIINQPHAAILSMDAVVKRPVVIEDDAIAVRSMMFMSMSFDHRILDGAGAGGFLQAVRTKLQSYGRDIDVY